MKQPESFVVEGKKHLVYRLKQSLYGLKQSPRCWNSTLDVHLKDMGYVQSTNDPSIYTLRIIYHWSVCRQLCGHRRKHRKNSASEDGTGPEVQCERPK